MLSVHVVDATSPGAPTCVLLHGFGATGDDLVPLAEELGDARYVFPEALLPMPAGWGPGRMWWMIDLDPERTDRREEIPVGLDAARRAVMQVLAEHVGKRPFVLGGFSQGAMLALDVALHLTTLPAGLILWSPTYLAQLIWAPKFARLQNVPIAMSHGREDPLLTFTMTEILRDELVAAGARVDFRAFHGGHQIPRAALDAATQIMSSIKLQS